MILAFTLAGYSSLFWYWGDILLNRHVTLVATFFFFNFLEHFIYLSISLSYGKKSPAFVISFSRLWQFWLVILYNKFHQSFHIYWHIFFLFSFFLLLRAVPSAYGSSQARGRIVATAASLHHSHATWNPTHVCNLHHSSGQHRIPKPLSEARDWIRVLRC